VERGVLFLSDILWLSHPNRLGLVQLFIFVGNLLDLLLFLFLLLFFFLDLGFFLILLFVFLLSLVFFFVALSDFLLSGLLNIQLNREANELGVLLHQVLDLSLF